MGPLLLGLASAFFFSVTFVLNREMELSGGSWMWSASLRYLFMLPLLFGVVSLRGAHGLTPLLRSMRAKPGPWLLWSTVGFGLFYAPLCYAATYSPGWLIAGTWQITIISGSLLAPFFWRTVQTPEGPLQVRGRIPVKGIAMSGIILAGVVLLQAEQAGSLSPWETAAGILPILAASFAYPLGNRKMMEVTAGGLDPFQRILGMTVASLPVWLVLSAAGLALDGPPSPGQVTQSLLVAVSSGVIATALFFRATDLVKGSMSRLAAVEATQSTEVLFTLAGETLLFAAPLPSALSWVGIGTVTAGMLLHSYISARAV
ncbi:DMT family transporter [Gorillibacterium sp. sgz5001074]|uniref:DMT family transporter n=1 Tax=Gorillibacterium sp. sgz5001074 TaxID=3446695 RepID=UPI003F67C3A3